MSKVPGIRRGTAGDERSWAAPTCDNVEHEHMLEDPPRPLLMVAVTDHWLCPEHDTVASPWHRDRVPAGELTREQRRKIGKIVARGNRRR